MIGSSRGGRWVLRYVATMLAITARGFVAATRTDAEARHDAEGLPDGFTFEMKVLPAGPSFRVRKSTGTFRLDEGTAKPDLSIQLKHLRHALRLFAFVESTPQALANNRIVVDGDVASAMRVQRILDRVMALLLPDFVAVRAIEALFPMTVGEKLRGSAKLAIAMAEDAMGGDR